MRRQLLMPHSYIATDNCEIRNNWQAIACEYNYGMVSLSQNCMSVLLLKLSMFSESR